MKIRNQLCLTGVAATAASLLGVPAPAQAAAPLEPVLALARRAWGEAPADRVLLYNPDAVALWLYQKYTTRFATMLPEVQLCLPMRSVMPSVTPVCFASMYSGLMPEDHGITTYEKPVLQCDTLFDALLRAGKRPAIVSTCKDSISNIFLDRKMDYFILDTPQACNQQAQRLIAADQHDLIVVYNADYDAAMHRNGPEAPVCLNTLSGNAAAFAALADAAACCWAAHRTVLGFLPDHGCHEIDGGLGSHGLDMPEDMQIVHFWGVQPPRPNA
ncbi:MAG: alkaline phosphatase family protein [Christensenellales bacterium]|jgi:hypothetical protein